MLCVWRHLPLCVCVCVRVYVCVCVCVYACAVSVCVRSCCLRPSHDVLILCAWRCVCQLRRWVWLLILNMWRHLCKYVCMYVCVFSDCVAVAVTNHVVICVFDVMWCVGCCRVCTWHTQSMYVCMCVCVCMYVCVLSVCIAVAVSDHVVMCIFDVAWCHGTNGVTVQTRDLLYDSKGFWYKFKHAGNRWVGPPFSPTERRSSVNVCVLHTYISQTLSTRKDWPLWMCVCYTHICVCNTHTYICV